MRQPERGDIWLADLNPIRGREQAGRRPVVIVSEDLFNQGPADLVLVCPLTSTLRGIPSHILVQPPEGGLRNVSVIMCEAIRSIAKERLIEAWGKVTPNTMAEVADRIAILLGL